MQPYQEAYANAMREKGKLAHLKTPLSGYNSNQPIHRSPSSSTIIRHITASMIVAFLGRQNYKTSPIDTMLRTYATVPANDTIESKVFMYAQRYDN